MQGVSTNFAASIAATSRTLHGRIIIDYTNPGIDASIAVTANETANVNKASQVANGEDSMSQKYASLDGSSWVLDGTFHLAPGESDNSSQFGWWGSQICTAGGTFPGTNPLLTVTFASRPVKSLKVVGDDKRSEYPVRFVVRLYNVLDTLLHTETVTGNNTFSWSKSITQVNSVVKTTLEIVQWSTANRQAKIAEFYTGIQETYEGDDSIDFSVTEERDISNGSLPIGNISANEIVLKLNNINNDFDAGNTAGATYELLKPNRRIRAWIGCTLTADSSVEYVPMGVFWSGDWETPENDIYAATSGRDIMDQMRTTTYSTSAVVINTTLYALAETVLQDYGLTAADYTIDTELQNYSVPYAWFEPMSHREALRKIVEACAGQAFVNRAGKVQVQGPSFLTATATAALTMTLNEIWNKSNPVKWSEVSNYVEVFVKPLSLASATETVYSSLENVSISAGQTLTERIYFNSSPCLSASVTISASDTANITISSSTTYSWGATVAVKNAATAAGTFKIFVNALPLSEVSKGKVVSQDANAILDSGKITYTMPENNLIQTTAFAQTLADKILATFKDPRRDITISWRGNPALDLADRITAPDYKAVSTQDYYVTRQTFDFDGGLVSTLQGRKAV